MTHGNSPNQTVQPTAETPAPKEQLTDEEKANDKKEQRAIKFMHGYGFRLSYEVSGEKQCTIVGFGDFGMHARIVDKNEFEYEDEQLGIKMKEEGDTDQHISIKRNSISSVVWKKEKHVNPENSEKRITTYSVYIKHEGGVFTMPFPETSKQLSIEFKRVVWQFANGMPLASGEKLKELTMQKSKEEN